MWDDWKAVVGVLVVTLGLRLIDYLAPKGHHNRWLKTYAEKDDPVENEEESSNES